MIDGHHLRRANVSSWPFSKLVRGEATVSWMSFLGGLHGVPV